MRVVNTGEFRGLKVNCGNNNQHFVREDILGNIYERLELMLHCYKRILVLRLDLRFPSGLKFCDHSSCIQNFMNQFSIFLKRRDLAYQYVWVREQKFSEHPHFHCAFFIEGGNYVDPSLFIGQAKVIWSRIATEVVSPEARSLVNVCRMDSNGLSSEDCYLSIDDEHGKEVFNNYFYWLSYLAKTNTKEVEPGRGRRVWGASSCKMQILNV